jgi:hypothetical protein
MMRTAHGTVDTSALGRAVASHPSLGHAGEADIEPMGLNCYQVSIGGMVRGFVRSTTGAGWECLVGEYLATAHSLGARRSYAAAVRDLVTPAHAALVAV